MLEKIERVENMCGGKGHVVIKHILGDRELNGKCRLYAEVTIAPGCTLGYHEHHGESETYYILSGKGDYNDNGTICKLPAGDVAICRPGESHGISNSGTETVRLVALILYK